MFLPQRDTLDKLIKAAKADSSVVATAHVVDDLDGSLLKELNDNFGALGDFKQDKQMVVFRDVSDVFDKPYLIAYQKDLDRSKSHMVQIEAEAIHLYHGQSNAKRSYHVIEAPQVAD